MTTHWPGHQSHRPPWVQAVGSAASRWAPAARARLNYNCEADVGGQKPAQALLFDVANGGGTSHPENWEETTPSFQAAERRLPGGTSQCTCPREEKKELKLRTNSSEHVSAEIFLEISIEGMIGKHTQEGRQSGTFPWGSVRMPASPPSSTNGHLGRSDGVSRSRAPIPGTPAIPVTHYTVLFTFFCFFVCPFPYL